MCHLYPYKNVKLLWKFFTLIFAVLLVGANFYMRPEYLTVAKFFYINIVERRMVVVEGENVGHHVKRRENCPGQLIESALEALFATMRYIN